MIYRVLDARTGEFRYVSAGHPCPVHQPAGVGPVIVESTGSPIGLAEEAYEERSVRLAAGDRLYLYSDGVSEAMNPGGELFGDARVLEAIGQGRFVSLQESIAALVGEIERWRGAASAEDDISILAVEVPVASGVGEPDVVPLANLHDSTRGDESIPVGRGKQVKFAGRVADSIRMRNSFDRCCRQTSLSGWFSPVLVVAAVTASGCMTTAEYARTAPRDVPTSEAVGVARLQSPAPAAAGPSAMPTRAMSPPLPDPRLPATAADAAAVSVDPSAVDDMATSSLPVAEPPIPAAVAPAGDGGSFGLWGLSSIARNRLANQVRATPLSDSGGMLADAADGRLTRAPVRSPAGGMSSILRNRLQAEGDVQYDYPDIHADPAKIYHDRFGIDEEHDRFLFPWLMDLIFEDRWLLSENDPAVAVQNQFRRRMKVDIRDPDPDYGQLPQRGVHPAQGPALHRELTRRVLWREQVLSSRLPVGVFASLRADRQPRVPHLLQRADRTGEPGETRRDHRLLAAGLRLQGQLLGGEHEIPHPSHGRGALPPDDLWLSRLQRRARSRRSPSSSTSRCRWGSGSNTTWGSPASRTHRVRSPISSAFSGRFSARWSRTLTFLCMGSTTRRPCRVFSSFQAATPNDSIPRINVVGVGAIWTVNDRLAIFGSYNFGTNPGSPRTIALTGFAVAF